MQISVRPTWDEYFMRQTYLAAQRATCDRKHVGAVIISPDHRVIATGYNGAPAGQPSCDDVGHELHDGHCIRTLHAEDNAISFAGRMAMSCTLYVTVIPCYDCAKRIVNVGIDTVVYDEFYGSRYGKSGHVVEFLQRAGVKVRQHESPGLELFKKALFELEAVERKVRATEMVKYTCGCEVMRGSATPKCETHTFSELADAR
jgi:dCMP deaminase